MTWWMVLVGLLVWTLIAFLVGIVFGRMADMNDGGE